MIKDNTKAVETSDSLLEPKEGKEGYKWLEGVRGGGTNQRKNHKDKERK